jgi:hypothetical protein
MGRLGARLLATPGLGTNMDASQEVTGPPNNMCIRCIMYVYINIYIYILYIGAQRRPAAVPKRYPVPACGVSLLVEAQGGVETISYRFLMDFGVLLGPPRGHFGAHLVPRISKWGA